MGSSVPFGELFLINSWDFISAFLSLLIPDESPLCLGWFVVVFSEYKSVILSVVFWVEVVLHSQDELIEVCFVFFLVWFVQAVVRQ